MDSATINQLTQSNRWREVFLQVPEHVFTEWCALGQRGDDLLADGHLDAALAVHRDLLARISASKVIDSLLVAKSVLSILLCNTLQGEAQSVNVTVTKEMGNDESLEAIGVYALQRGQTEVHDLMIYYTILAWMYSNAAGDQESAAQAVDRYMHTVCDYALEKDQSLFPQVLINWRAFLQELRDGGPIPNAWAQELDKYIRIYGHALPESAPVLFSSPTPWSLMSPPTAGTVFHPDGKITRLGD